MNSCDLPYCFSLVKFSHFSDDRSQSVTRRIYGWRPFISRSEKQSHSLFILEIMRIRSVSSSFHSAVRWKTWDSRKIMRECIVSSVPTNKEKRRKTVGWMQSTSFPLLLHKSRRSRQGPFPFWEPFNSFFGMRDELKTAACQKAKRAVMEFPLGLCFSLLNVGS